MRDKYTKSSSKRLLRPEEKALLRAMASSCFPESKLEATLQGSEVEDLLDGGMGSIRVVNETGDQRRLGKVISEAEYLDSDGVLVTISINLDQNDNLFEVDFWKVDFSPLCQYPGVEDIKIVRPK